MWIILRTDIYMRVFTRMVQCASGTTSCTNCRSTAGFGLSGEGKHDIFYCEDSFFAQRASVLHAANVHIEKASANRNRGVHKSGSGASSLATSTPTPKRDQQAATRARSPRCQTTTSVSNPRTPNFASKRGRGT